MDTLLVGSAVTWQCSTRTSRLIRIPNCVLCCFDTAGADIESFVKFHVQLDSKQMSWAFSLFGANYPNWQQKIVAFNQFVIVMHIVAFIQQGGNVENFRLPSLQNLSLPPPKLHSLQLSIQENPSLQQGRYAKVMWTYPRSSENEVSAVDGDIVQLLEDPDGGWALVLNKHTGQEGFLPTDYLDPYSLPDGIDDETLQSENGLNIKPFVAYATKAAFSFSATEKDEVPLRAGEEVTVVGRSRDDDAWCFVRKATGEEGLVPLNHLEQETSAAAQATTHEPAKTTSTPAAIKVSEPDVSDGASTDAIIDSSDASDVERAGQNSKGKKKLGKSKKWGSKKKKNSAERITLREGFRVQPAISLM